MIVGVGCGMDIYICSALKSIYIFDGLWGLMVILFDRGRNCRG